MGSESPLENINEPVDSTPEAAVENTAEAAETSATPSEDTPEISSSTPRQLEALEAKMKLQGTVERVELQGAIVDVGLEQKGLLHISQLSTEMVKNVSDVVKEGDEITVYVMAVDKKKGRLDLTMIEPPDVMWSDLKTGEVRSGEVVRIEKFGVFVDVGAERPGLIHISELATGYVNDPNTIVSLGDTIEAKVIGVNRKKKQIDLSVRALEQATARAVVEEYEAEESLPSAMEIALRRAMEASDVELPLSRKEQKRRGKRKDRSREQDDIVSRTLRMHND